MNLIPGVPDSVLNQRYGLSEYEAEQEWTGAFTPAPQLPSADKPRLKLEPVDLTGQSGNVLRPTLFTQIIGQDRAKVMLSRMIDASLRRDEPLEHCLFVGPSGTGKTTLAHVCAHALGGRVWQLEAPISAETLLELARAMQRGDILFLDEIHQQAVGDRRGRSSSTQPEVLFSVMEDRTLPTGEGVVQFPHITIMGATTDEGMLPDAFINRFPIRPRLVRYTVEQMEQIAMRNGPPLKVALSPEAARVFARASRAVPREINNYVRIASSLTEDGYVDDDLATEVLSFAGVSKDGLTGDMQEMLLFLLRSPKHSRATGETRYQASVDNIATAIGKSRDSKAVKLRIEPYLIEQGLVQVAHGGRVLTDRGIVRAKQLKNKGE